MIIVNKDAWNKLDKATQDLVMSQAALAERKGWQLSKQGNVGDKKALADAGMVVGKVNAPLHCLLYTSPSPRDMRRSRMPSSA